MDQQEVQDADLDSEESQALLRQILTWLAHERDRQSANRVEMARDHDFYDGLQWTEADAQVLSDRGQAPLVFNQVKVAVDWLLGSEKRNRVDWRVLPREEDDFEMATVKTKVLKYVSDVNLLPFARSQAFAEAAIAGMSWLEDSLNSDATGDILYSGYESWRNCLGDSHSRRLDYKDGRYHFRWKVMDLDVAQAMFKTRKGQLAKAAMSASQIASELDKELWYLGENLSETTMNASGDRAYNSDINTGNNRRTRVRVFECWYKMPEEVQTVSGGTFHGEKFDPQHAGMAKSIDQGYAEVIKSTRLVMKVIFFTERDVLAMGDSPFKHNDFPFTPVYCFRRGRDMAPYGYVRNMRDAQDDLNKRMSKSLFLLSVNQIITEVNAFDTEGEYTLENAIENASNPQGVFVLKDGNKKFEIRRDFAEINGQHQQIELDMRFMQTGSGITDELLGRKTNAVSGKAVEARQDQGSMTTSGIFDTYRLAINISGQKQLSNSEKFYSTPKVIRLTQWAPSVPDQPTPENPKPAGTGLDWVRINQPEVQPDGSVRFLNDMTASVADFIVDEQDFRANMRQAMFESLSAMLDTIGKFSPQFAVSMLDMVVDLADFPGKEGMVQRLKQLIAEARGETPAAQQAAVAQQAELAKKSNLQDQATATSIVKDQTAADLNDAKADQIRTSLIPGAVALDPQRTPEPTAGAASASTPTPTPTPTPAPPPQVA
jgi:hypothetical protein